MDRRKFVTAAGGMILAGHAPSILGESPVASPSSSCKATTRLTRGPYLLPSSPRRSDIRDNVQGVPLKLELTVLNDLWCTPAPEFVVDIWHCDANGLYSGVDNIVFDPNSLRVTDQAINMKDKKFLRGHQVTDDRGKVEFLTIYPGWYMPRLSHIHVRLIWRDVEWTALDTQLFLPAEVERNVYQTEPYATRGANPTGVERDIVMKGDADSVRDLTVNLERDGEGFRGHYEIAALSL